MNIETVIQNLINGVRVTEKLYSMKKYSLEEANQKIENLKNEAIALIDFGVSRETSGTDIEFMHRGEEAFMKEQEGLAVDYE